MADSLANSLARRNVRRRLLDVEVGRTPRRKSAECAHLTLRRGYGTSARTWHFGTNLALRRYKLEPAAGGRGPEEDFAERGRRLRSWHDGGSPRVCVAWNISGAREAFPRALLAGPDHHAVASHFDT